MDGSGAQSVYAFQREVRRDEKSVHRRLMSIKRDADFVQRFARGADRAVPLVANLSCGAWYAPRFDENCYFKSTDGHYGKWQFNLRRLNLHVARLAYTQGGVVLVDSTRKGKAFPDSFNRTVPIWTAVLNRALAHCKGLQIENNTAWMALHMPPWISPSECHQIEERLSAFVASLLENDVLRVAVRELSQLANKPLCAVCVNPHSSTSLSDILALSTQSSSIYALAFIDKIAEFCPIVCLSASLQQDSAPVGYIQGAGDDEDAWAHNLTPSLFWANAEYLLDDADFTEDRVHQIVTEGCEDDTSDSSTIYRLAGTPFAFTDHPLDISQLEDEPLAVIDCGADAGVSGSVEGVALCRTPIPPGKKAKWTFVTALECILPFVAQQIAKKRRVILVAAHDTNAVFAVTLAVLVCFYDEEWAERTERTLALSKTSIRTVLYRLQQSTREVKLARHFLLDLNRLFLAPNSTIVADCLAARRVQSDDSY